MSTATFQTLKGIFNEPKMNHRRDFLRENKLNLRELERNTTQKNQCAAEEKRHKDERYLKRRSTSTQRRQANEREDSTSSHMYVRSHSQQREQNAAADAHYHYNQGRSNGLSARSSATMLSKTQSCDKQIQTEDIYDKQFLYAALKKCNSNNDNVSMTAGLAASNGPISTHSHNTHAMLCDEQNKKCYYPEQQQATRKNQRQQQQYAAEDNYEQDEQSPRSQASLATVYARQPHRGGGGDGGGVSDGEELDTDFGNMALDDKYEQEDDAHNELPLSGRSRHTTCSNHQSHDAISIKSTQSSRLMGKRSRDDVRLPRYLERKKREKEEHRMRELERDPNCPKGHILVPEEERLQSLERAQSKFQQLVHELNHMPMTSETLRVRTRKGEIEKELILLEVDIQVFSKPKVYIKEENYEKDGQM